MPLVSVNVSTETKIVLDSLSILLQLPTGRIVEVVTSSYLIGLPKDQAQIVNDLKDAALARLAAVENTTGELGGPPPVVTYKFSRLCFKREIIESLGASDAFRVETPVGTFQMTKGDFYKVFPNVIQSRSYAQDGIYHYRKLPSQAERFRIP